MAFIERPSVQKNFCRVGKVSWKQGGKDENFFRRTRVKNPPTQPLRWKTFRMKHKHGRFTREGLCLENGLTCARAKTGRCCKLPTNQTTKRLFPFFCSLFVACSNKREFLKRNSQLILHSTTAHVIRKHKQLKSTPN